MNYLVAKTYNQMKNTQTNTEQPKDTRTIVTKPVSLTKLQSEITLEIAQNLQMLIVNLPYYKSTRTDIKVKAFENISQIQRYAKIHFDKMGNEIKQAVYNTFSYSELKELYNAFKHSKNEDIAQAYSKLRTYFDDLNNQSFSFAYDILSMLCEYMEVELSQPELKA